jgi:hypothetical protein
VLEAPVVVGWTAWCDLAHRHEIAFLGTASDPRKARVQVEDAIGRLLKGLGY